MTPMTRDDVRRQIAEIVGIDPDAVTEDADLMDLGLDSMRAMRLAQRWVQAGVPVEFSELAEEATLRHWWSVLARVMRVAP
jgi:aryl carrier-like protein